MTTLLTAVFGKREINHAALWLRGFVCSFAASSIGAGLYLLNQWANDLPVDWSTAKQVFVFNVVPTVGLWLTGLKAWLQSQSQVSADELNKLLGIAIQLPRGATPDDVIAIYQQSK